MRTAGLILMAIIVVGAVALTMTGAPQGGRWLDELTGFVMVAGLAGAVGLMLARD